MSFLEVSGLEKRYSLGRDVIGRTKNWFTAVDKVSFELERGETLALVGESGAGKSTTGRLLLRLIEPDAGDITFDGVDIRAVSRRDMRGLRRRLQMIFQDPYGSFDPRLPIGESVAEPLLVHFGMGRKERLRKATALLERVGMSGDVVARAPSELSGGQLQRAAIARALTLEPDVIVADEPVAALDVSVQAQVLNLMHDLQLERELSYIFITHDLSLVQVIADRIAVMQAGKIVELNTCDAIFASPGQEYTRTLLDSIPQALPPSLRNRTRSHR